MAARLKPLHEQVIVVTGASSGNGLAIAREAARRGAAVVLAARNQDALEHVAEQIGAEGGRAAVCVADVSSDEDVERIAATAIEEFGGFDSWINDAAAASYGTVEEVPIEDHKRIFDVNYFGVVRGSRIAARHLRQRGGGAIVNIGSVLSDRAMILQGPYSASKHAVEAATDALRMELEREGAGISVTLIKPGSIATPYPEHARNFMDAPPQLPPFLYEPKLVADAVLFACETPRRQIYVGGSGYLISLMGRIAPRLTDMVMEAVGVQSQQKPGDPGDPERRDNLYEPRSEGEERGSQERFVRTTSLMLEAQTNPLRVPMVAAEIAMHGLSRMREMIEPREEGRRGVANRDRNHPARPTLHIKEPIVSNLTQQFIDALRHLEESGEPDRIVALFSEDADISNPVVKHEGEGNQGAERFWRSYRGAFQSITSEFRNVVENEGVAMLEWVSSGTSPTGPFRYGGVSVIEHHHGRISSFRSYFDPAQAAG